MFPTDFIRNGSGAFRDTHSAVSQNIRVMLDRPGGGGFQAWSIMPGMGKQNKSKPGKKKPQPIEHFFLQTRKVESEHNSMLAYNTFPVQSQGLEGHSQVKTGLVRRNANEKKPG